jgi:5-methylcytosine-specific restriction endonuclease McrA
MDASLKETLRPRAGFSCEYCHLPEAIAELPFQVDHIVAAQHGGMSTEENLAWACARCNRYKGPNLSGIDPESGKLTRLFNPRTDAWVEHFSWNDAILTGQTAIGRTTIAVLQINHPEAKSQRVDLLAEGISF